MPMQYPKVNMGKIIYQGFLPAEIVASWIWAELPRPGTLLRSDIISIVAKL